MQALQQQLEEAWQQPSGLEQRCVELASQRDEAVRERDVAIGAQGAAEG